MPSHQTTMSFRKAVRIAIRPTATIARSSPYSAIAAPSSSRRKRRTPCIMRFMRGLLERKETTTSTAGEPARRNLAVLQSQRRASHDRVSVSGDKGACKESTHHGYAAGTKKRLPAIAASPSPNRRLRPRKPTVQLKAYVKRGNNLARAANYCVPHARSAFSEEGRDEFDASQHHISSLTEV